MDLKAKRALIEHYLEAYNNFDIDAMLAVIHPEIEFKNISNHKINATALGKEAFRQLAEQAKSVFASRQQKIRRVQMNGDYLQITIIFRGVVNKSLPNGFKKGSAIEVEGTSEFQFKDNLIYRITDIS